MFASFPLSIDLDRSIKNEACSDLLVSVEVMRGRWPLLLEVLHPRKYALDAERGQFARGNPPIRNVRTRFERNDVEPPVLKHGPWSPTITRALGWQTRKRNESEKVRLFCYSQDRPVLIFGEGSEFECVCWDPKDGELFLDKAKSREILMEA